VDVNIDIDLFFPSIPTAAIVAFLDIDIYFLSTHISASIVVLFSNIDVHLFSDPSRGRRSRHRALFTCKDNFLGIYFRPTSRRWPSITLLLTNRDVDFFPRWRRT